MQPWIFSAKIDSLFILCGIWLTLLLIPLYVLWPVSSEWMGVIALAVLWGAHIVSPMYLAWSDVSFRGAMFCQKSKFIYFPILIFSLMFAGAFWGVLYLRYMVFYLFLAANCWHFAGQHFGVLSLYRIRSQLNHPLLRRVDRLYSLCIVCCLLPMAWYLEGVTERVGPLVRYGAELSQRMTKIPVFGLTLLVFLIFVVLSKQYGGLNRARILYGLSMAIQPVFAVISYAHFNIAVFLVCHWLIALTLSYAILKNREREWNAAKFVVCSLGISLTLYFVLLDENVLSSFNLFDWGKYLAYASGEQSYWLAALSGIYFGMTMVHILYDRYVYSFRNHEVRQSIAPFLLKSSH